jgi:hypothetical protein
MKSSRRCACGCGGATKGGEFRPGHDAKLRSQLIAKLRSETDGRKRNAVVGQLRKRGWTHGIQARIEAESPGGMEAGRSGGTR